MYIPQKLKPYFTEIDTKSTTNTIIHGQITCCAQSEFNVFYYGNIKKGLLGHQTLCDAKDGLIIILQCRKCGKKIELFNSFTDGYERCISDSTSHDVNEFQQLFCKTNAHSDFAAEVTFEYPPKEELIEDNITVFDNAFSWIWITLKCSNCKNLLKNIVDYETA